MWRGNCSILASVGDKDGPLRTLDDWSRYCSRSPDCRHSPQKKNLMRAELTQRGRSGLVHARLLLTQHFFAVAADLMLRCSPSRGSGHSVIPTSVDFRPSLQCSLNELTEGGTELPLNCFKPIIALRQRNCCIGNTTDTYNNKLEACLTNLDRSYRTSLASFSANPISTSPERTLNPRYLAWVKNRVLNNSAIAA